ncbi:MAG: methylated-DNA--[protein]-cysteine S-methyltransferase [Candidatus Acidulodesulfobacterium sp.]
MPINKNAETVYFYSEHIATPIGEMIAVVDSEKRLRALDWTDCETRMYQLFRLQYIRCDVKLIAGKIPIEIKQKLNAYWQGDIESIDYIPVKTCGTCFQQEAWSVLRTIPAGKTISYKIQAAKIGKPSAIRAVALADKFNPILIVIPCHRIIGSDGSICGYAGGLKRKQWLLKHEGVYLK